MFLPKNSFKKGFVKKLYQIKSSVSVGEQKSKKVKYPALNLGVTFIELIVVLSIIGIISSVVAYNHRSFSDRIELTNAAYEMALLFREAQSAGSSVRPEEEVFDYPYGIFSRIPGGAVGPNKPKSDKSIVLFVDIDGDGSYPGGFENCQSEEEGQQECISILELPENVIINKICGVISDNGDIECPGSVVGMSTTFLRPKLDAESLFFNPGDQEPGFSEGEPIGAVFCLESDLGNRISVEMLETGQVTVKEAYLECGS